MAEFGGEHIVKVGEDGEITLDEPTNRQWNEYEAEKVKVRGRKVETTVPQAQANLFDKIVRSLKNITVGGQPVGMDNLDLIPVRRKAAIIEALFERDREEVEVKNS